MIPIAILTTESQEHLANLSGIIASLATCRAEGCDLKSEVALSKYAPIGQIALK